MTHDFAKGERVETSALAVTALWETALQETARASGFGCRILGRRCCGAERGGRGRSERGWTRRRCGRVGLRFNIHPGQIFDDMRGQRAVELQPDPCALSPRHFGHKRPGFAQRDLHIFAEHQAPAKIIHSASAQREIIDIHIALEPARGAVCALDTGGEAFGSTVFHGVLNIGGHALQNDGDDLAKTP